jgi:hypothetical protein
MAAHPAQADNLATDRAVSMLRVSANLLLTQAEALQQRPTRTARAALKRVLSGVLADVETVRVSIKD